MEGRERSQLEAVLAEEFGADSPMYRDGLAVFDHLDSHESGIPEPYRKYWQPYTTTGVLRHVTVAQSVRSIQQTGLQPHDPFPRPWAGMRAVFMSEPEDPEYLRIERQLIDHARRKGGHPVLLIVRTPEQLYRSSEPERTFQVISLTAIVPENIVEVSHV